MTIDFTAAPTEPEMVGPARVLLGLDLEPPTQKRATIVFRAILAFPLLFVAAALNYIIEIVGIAAWFAALFTKKVPEGLQTFMTSCLRVVATTTAYSHLLIARWPAVPFDQEDEKWLSLRIDRVEHNRAAVFFRAILAVPAIILQGLLSVGGYLLVMVMWIVGIFTGKTPRSLHQAVCAILRYSTRATAYLFLLTPTQPWHGLFGDEGAPAELPTLSTEGSDEGNPVAPLPFAPPTTAPAPELEVQTPVADLPTDWGISKGARRGVGAAIGLGALFMAAYLALFVWLIGSLVPQAEARSATVSSYNNTSMTVQTFLSSVVNCGDMACRQNASTTTHTSMISIVSNFENDYGSYSGEPTLYADYDASLRKLRDDFGVLSRTSDQIEFGSYMAVVVSQDAITLRQTGHALVIALGGKFIDNSSSASMV